MRVRTKMYLDKYNHLQNILSYIHKNDFQLYLYNLHQYHILHCLSNIHSHLINRNILNKNYDQKKFIPSQLKPFPSYPNLHEQLKLPGEFMQMAFTSHPPLFTEHSSISFVVIGLLLVWKFIIFFGSKKIKNKK